MVLKIGVANAINGKSLIIFHALSICNGVLAVEREVEMEIGVFLLQLPEVLKEEGFTQSACSIEEVKLAVACVERLGHVHDLSANGVELLLKAVSVASVNDLKQCGAYDGIVDYFVFDTKTPDYGGSGKCFDWEVLRHYKGTAPFLLSGGLGMHNTEELLRFQHPRWCGIDLNSCFEVVPGYKDVALLKQYLQTVREIL